MSAGTASGSDGSGAIVNYCQATHDCKRENRPKKAVFLFFYAKKGGKNAKKALKVPFLLPVMSYVVAEA